MDGKGLNGRLNNKKPAFYSGLENFIGLGGKFASGDAGLSMFFNRWFPLYPQIYPQPAQGGRPGCPTLDDLPQGLMMDGPPRGYRSPGRAVAGSRTWRGPHRLPELLSENKVTPGLDLDRVSRLSRPALPGTQYRGGFLPPCTELYCTRPAAKIQIAPAPEASTVKDVAAVNTIPSWKSHWLEVFAAIAIGPIKAVVTAPPVSPSPMVIEIALAPLLMVK